MIDGTFSPLAGLFAPSVNLPRPPRTFGGPIVLAGLIALAACAAVPKALVPDQPPPAVQVLVPVPTPCEVQKVEPSPLVTERLGGAGSELYEAVKRILADRALLISDRTRLVAANSDPCPAGTLK